MNGRKTTVLYLSMHREFFAQIAAGTKCIEYRRTPYWRRRLEGRHYDVIQFRNGSTERGTLPVHGSRHELPIQLNRNQGWTRIAP